MIVLVGPAKRRFDLFKGLLCHTSKFFESALTGNFKEKDGTLELPEQDPKDFAYFVHWAYTGKLRGFFCPKTIKPTIKKRKLAAIAEAEEEGVINIDRLDLDDVHYKALALADYRDAPFSSLVSLYILADVLLVDHLKDSIIALLVEVYGSSREGVTDKGAERHFWFHPNDLSNEFEEPQLGINLAWEKLPPDSKLRSVIVNLFCDNIIEMKGLAEKTLFDMQFMVAVADKYARRWYDNEGLTDWKGADKICEYHEHGAVDTCPVEPE